LGRRGGPRAHSCLPGVSGRCGSRVQGDSGCCGPLAHAPIASGPGLGEGEDFQIGGIIGRTGGGPLTHGRRLLLPSGCISWRSVFGSNAGCGTNFDYFDYIPFAESPGHPGPIELSCVMLPPHTRHTRPSHLGLGWCLGGEGIIMGGLRSTTQQKVAARSGSWVRATRVRETPGVHGGMGLGQGAWGGRLGAWVLGRFSWGGVEGEAEGGVGGSWLARARERAGAGAVSR
jgi:hypothetical protein